MRIRKNGKVIRLTESDLMRITRKVLREQDETKKSKGGITITDDMLRIPGGVEEFKKIIKKLAGADSLVFGDTIQTDENGDYIPSGYMGWAYQTTLCEGVLGSTTSVDRQWCKVLSVGDKKYLSKFIQMFLNMGFLRKDPSTNSLTHIGAKLQPEKIYLKKQKQEIK